MTRSIALLRGINVGTAKQVSMADLTEVFRGQGHTEVTTVLRSGNVVFAHDAPLPAGVADDLQSAIAAATGVSSSVLVVDAPTLRAIVEANPLLDVGTDHSRLVVGFVSGRPDPATTPDPASLAPEQLVVGERAVYQWCPDGISRSRVPPAFWREVAPLVTVRNWRTVLRLAELVGVGSSG